MADGNVANRLGEELQASPQKTNFMRLIRLLIGGGTRALRELFDSKILPRDLTNKLKHPSVVSTLYYLRNRKILTQGEWNILHPPPGVVVESTSFDITLVFKLLRNICDLTPPANGWDKLPNSTDDSLEANMARIKYYRNTVYAHVNNMEISDEDFENYWSEIKKALLSIYQAIDSDPRTMADCEKIIDQCLASPIDEDINKDLNKLKWWCKVEELLKNTALRLDEFDQKIRELQDVIFPVGSTRDIVYPEITIKPIIKLDSKVWMAGSACMLYMYTDDPETFLKLVNEFVLPTGALMLSMTEGSIRLHVRVDTLDGLEELWTRYETGRLREDLENVFVNKFGLKEKADGDVVEVEVTISEDEYTRARKLLKAVQHDEDAHEDSHSRYDKDDPAKSTKVANQDPDGTRDETQRAKRSKAANQDPDRTRDETQRAKRSKAANQDPDGTSDETQRAKRSKAANQDPDGTRDETQRAKSTEAATQDPYGTRDETQRVKSTEAATQDFDGSSNLEIIHGKQFKDGESIFQIHLAFVTSLDQADHALKMLEKKSNIADASYRIQACRIFNKERKSFIENCDDYGSTKVGARLLRLLEMTDARNVVVILTCWQSGKLRKPIESLINQSALDLLSSSGRIKRPSNEKELLKEVEDYFEFMKQQEAKRPSIRPRPQPPKIEIFHGKAIEDRRSKFQAHLARITTQDQVEQVLAELKKDRQVGNATYNAYAYRILDERSCIEDFDDDGESFAGESLLHLLQMTGAKDVIVIVTRWHSRIALGRTRFKYINQTALELLQEADLVKLTSTDVQELLKKEEEYLEKLKRDGETPPHTTVQAKIKIKHGGKVEDRRSSFQAHVAVISSREQVDKVSKELRKDQDIANATYNIHAYRIFDEETWAMVQDCDDDGEYLAGASLLHLLEVLDVQNVMVTVSRWHGGIPLGRDRFKHIHRCALKLLQSEGFVETLMPDKEQEMLARLDKHFDYFKENTTDYYTEIPKPCCPKIIHGACLEDRKSTFQAHLAVVTSREEVEQVLAEVKKNRLVAKATYNILAYRIFDKENDAYMEDCHDDGEIGAGERLLHLLQQAGAKNIVAVVTRWHGDILLGSTRFRLINECVESGITKLSFRVC